MRNESTLPDADTIDALEDRMQSLGSAAEDAAEAASKLPDIRYVEALEEKIRDAHNAVNELVGKLKEAADLAASLPE